MYAVKAKKNQGPAMVQILDATIGIIPQAMAGIFHPFVSLCFHSIMSTHTKVPSKHHIIVKVSFMVLVTFAFITFKFSRCINLKLVLNTYS